MKLELEKPWQTAEFRDTPSDRGMSAQGSAHKLILRECGEFPVCIKYPTLKNIYLSLLNMIKDLVSAVVENRVIAFTEHLLNMFGYQDPTRLKYKRQQMGAGEKPEPSKAKECLPHQAHFSGGKGFCPDTGYFGKPATMHLANAVKQLAGLSVAAHPYECPRLALKIGHSLLKISLQFPRMRMQL